MPSSVSGLSSNTPEAYRRQGHYEKLMRGLINAGISVRSDERNSDSQPFHEEFQNRMTPNMKIKYGDETDGSRMQPFTYSREIPRSRSQDAFDYLSAKKPENSWRYSDLAQRDYGAMPIQQLPPVARYGSTIGSKQTKLDEFIPPPPPQPPVEWDKLRQTMPWGNNPNA